MNRTYIPLMTQFWEAKYHSSKMNWNQLLAVPLISQVTESLDCIGTSVYFQLRPSTNHTYGNDRRWNCSFKPDTGWVNTSLASMLFLKKLSLTDSNCKVTASQKFGFQVLGKSAKSNKGPDLPNIFLAGGDFGKWPDEPSLSLTISVIPPS